MKALLHSKTLLFIVVVIFLITLGGYGGYRYWQLRQDNIFLAQQVADLKSYVLALHADMAKSKEENGGLTENLDSEKSKNSDLSEALQSEQDKNKIFEAEIRDISGTVGTLQKLSKTDPELLQKYSKVYFLSENYVPAQLSAIDSQYIYDKNKPELIHAGVNSFLEWMLASAARDGITLQVVSAYRSFAEQAYIKTGYKLIYGSGANKFSSDQGYSEHQLGTTIDLTTPELKGLSPALEKSSSYKWLTENAYRFGFILSYPKNNLYYQFEPWHWRFVGAALATSLHNQNKYFYELTQREINQYLVSIFD